MSSISFNYAEVEADSRELRGTRLSSVSATYTLLNLIDAAVDEALMPIKRYLYFLKAIPV